MSLFGLIVLFLQVYFEMDKSLYRAHGDLEEDHWWFRGRRAVIRSFLSMIPRGQSRALDIGCGTGRNTLMLREIAGEVYGMEDSDEAIRLAKEKHPWLSVVKGSLPSVPLEGAFDCITMFDVLEHIEDDTTALVSLQKKLNPGGYMLLTVPAYRILWSEHDDLAHHKRRYTKRELLSKLRAANYEIIGASYFNTFLFPVVLFVRLFKRLFGITSGGSDFFMLPGPLNAMLAKLFSSEAFFVSKIGMPFGVSLICLAKKRF